MSRCHGELGPCDVQVRSSDWKHHLKTLKHVVYLLSRCLFSCPSVAWFCFMLSAVSEQRAKHDGCTLKSGHLFSVIRSPVFNCKQMRCSPRKVHNSSPKRRGRPVHAKLNSVCLSVHHLPGRRPCSSTPKTRVHPPGSGWRWWSDTNSPTSGSETWSPW